MRLTLKLFLTAFVAAFAYAALAQTNAPMPGQIRARKTSYTNGQTQEWVEVWGNYAPSLRGRTNSHGVVTNWTQGITSYPSNGWHWVKAPVSKPWRVTFTNTPALASNVYSNGNWYSLSTTNVPDAENPGWKLQLKLQSLVAPYGGAATNKPAANVKLFDDALKGTNATGKVNVLADELQMERLYREMADKGFNPRKDQPTAAVPVYQRLQ